MIASALIPGATALLGGLSWAELDGQLNEKLVLYTRPKLLIIDELVYLSFEKRSAHLFFQPRGTSVRTGIPKPRPT